MLLYICSITYFDFSSFPQNFQSTRRYWFLHSPCVPVQDPEQHNYTPVLVAEVQITFVRPLHVRARLASWLRTSSRTVQVIHLLPTVESNRALYRLFLPTSRQRCAAPLHRQIRVLLLRAEVYLCCLITSWFTDEMFCPGYNLILVAGMYGWIYLYAFKTTRFYW